MSNNAHELSNRLLNALDNNYNVVDMHAVNEIISILEKINITKELLETTRLGKHVNELRRKTSEPTLARRAKVLVRRWRDLVIPAAASPQNTGSNRSSAERQTRRLGGTPITSPAFARQVDSPAVPSPRPPSRPAWGGYESDSQDVILVDDDPPPPPAVSSLASAPVVPSPLTLNTHTAPTPPKRQMSPEASHDEKKAKRDKKPKKRRGHSRAGSGTETPPSVPPAPLPLPLPVPPPAGAGAAWAGRNGTHSDRKKNGVRSALDPYAALVNKMPPVGAKKVKTTKELLAQIQSRGSRRGAGARSPASPGRAAPAPPAGRASPASPADPGSPDVMFIEPDEPSPVKMESPLRNGGSPLAAAPPPLPPPAPTPPPLAPLEDEREVRECTCGEEQDDECPAARRTEVLPIHVHALHHAYLPGVNGTRAPLHPHRFAVRKLDDPERPELFASIVPLYNYSDYADDYCVKNMVAVPLCTHLPWTEFAAPPPELPPPPSPPPPRPYPLDDDAEPAPEPGAADPAPEPGAADPAPEPGAADPDPAPAPGPAVAEAPTAVPPPGPVVEPEMVSAPPLEPSERLKAPIIATEDETLFRVKKCDSVKTDVPDEFESEQQEHRTVERTKSSLDGRALYELCAGANRAVPFNYGQTFAAPTVTLPEAGGAAPALAAALARAAAATRRDARARPEREPGFAEWHECAQLGDLLALPYVVID